jgi:hypothetical protein
MLFKRKKYPVMWIIEGNEEIPVEWDYRRLDKLIDKLVKLIEKSEKNKNKLRQILRKHPKIIV